MKNLRIEARSSDDPARLRELILLNWRLAAEVLHNPSVSAELLSFIFSTYQYRSLRGQIIKHANCPPALLLREGPRYSSALFENPALPLLLLEDPNFYEKLDVKGAGVELMKYPLPAPYIDWILSKKDGYLSACLLENPSLSTEQIERIVSQFKGQDTHNERIAKHPKTPGWFLEQMSWSRDFKCRVAASNNPSTPISVLLELTQYETGTNKRLSVLHKPPSASTEQSIELRVALAKNPSTPAAAIDLLSRDLSPKVKAEVASHANATDEALLRLVDEPLCRFVILGRRRLSAALLSSLTASSRPDELLRLLSRQDVSLERFEQIRARPKRVSKEVLSEASSLSLFISLARHPETPLDRLAQFASSANEVIREAVTQNDNAPASLLAALCGDENARVRVRAAAHKSAPQELLRLMYQAGASVDLANIGRPRRELTPDERERLQQSGPFGAKLAEGASSYSKDPLLLWLWGGFRKSIQTKVDEAELKSWWLQAKGEASEAALTAFIDHDNAFIRARVASNPNLSETQRSLLASDNVWFVRLAVALSPQVSAAILGRLCNDPDLRIRRVIARHLLLPPDKREILLQDTKKKVRRAAASHYFFPVIKKRGPHPPSAKPMVPPLHPADGEGKLRRRSDP